MHPEEIITSRDNAKLKLVRSVRDGREDGLIFIEGFRLVDEAIRSGLEIDNIFLSADVGIAGRATELDSSTLVEPKIFRSLSDTNNSQGIIAIARRPAWTLDDISDGSVVMLHRVNNPSNLGAVVRTAEAAGVAGVITTMGAADAFSPKALRASMGSSFRLPVIQGLSFDDLIEWARNRQLVSTAADISGNLGYTDVDWKVPRLLVFGSEAHGLDDRDLELIDEKIVIRMENEVESLNLAVSCGIILFEAKRQRMG